MAGIVDRIAKNTDDLGDTYQIDNILLRRALKKDVKN